MTSRATGTRVVAALSTALALGMYRRWHLRWGATNDEVRRHDAGDDHIEHPWFADTSDHDRCDPATGAEAIAVGGLTRPTDP